MIRVLVGYDGRESVASSVLAHSIQSVTGVPVMIGQIRLDQVAEVFTRERDPKQSTDFAFSRFLVPWMCGYRGWALFLDSDIFARSSLEELWSLRDEEKAVMVVKHDYVPVAGEKFLGQVQSVYPKKNWSSVMLFNNARCQRLTPEYVNTASGMELHQFKWLESDEEIGDLPQEWNHLVGEYPPNDQAKLIHFTLGGPWWQSFRECEFASEWFALRDEMLYYQSEQ